MQTDLERLVTEGRNPQTLQIDQLDSWEILRLINREDQLVALAVQQELPAIAQAVDLIVAALTAGGRLLYVGAGTSGRLGVLDAAECPPTFGTDPDLVQAVIAGGERAIRLAVEQVEDQPELGRQDLLERGVDARDVVVGIAASGHTPYALGALRAAQAVGAQTVALTMNPNSPLAQLADLAISPVVGPEVIMGSTRLKAGTAQKLVLNMLSTASMIRLGKVYSNLMVDLQPTNAKLVERSQRIVQLATGCAAPVAAAALQAGGGRPKLAIVMILAQVDTTRAAELLSAAGGFVRRALELAGKEVPQCN